MKSSFLAIALLLLPGCAAYQVGTGSLYAPDVSTVFVPMIESESFRRDLGERLTEALVKEIELKTPYKVVADPNADSVLLVRLQGDTRGVLAENALDDPRVLEETLRAEVTWLNRRQLPMMQAQSIPTEGALAGLAVGVGQTGLTIPEAAQTLTSTQQEAIKRLAEQIVGTMERPW
ncbi:hypothetical protein Mal64_16820 [Pseudobythopirellula maris]|uniref:Lipopolysaccharide-assembly n=1 Tax=Pseudobythopirellula maris TaxID=2527991 RepID=A0A5C5ZP38_9BACT|nr:LPS assembly lipoprotein LptE [Pseudobythopirellula maris]TWT88203.1 hypothetical protein Mal64_16820 [Pseudobythopirellula maris]